ncbi:MAG: FtsX-like permease family protein [Streptosporangiaceae bacterium]
MGKLVVIWRLATKDLLRAKTRTVLTVTVIAAATATLTLGLALNGATSDPYGHTRAATAGPDVMVQSNVPTTGKDAPTGAPADLIALEHAPGVVGYSGPYPVATPALVANGHTVSSQDGGFVAEGREQARASVDQPKVLEGTWVRPGAVVIESTYATELGLVPGDSIMLDGRSLRVAGVAVTAAWPSVNWPGILWLTEADARSLATPKYPLSYLLDLKLANPAAATAFANAHSTNNLSAFSWQQISHQDARGIELEQEALVIGTWLLSMLAIACIAVLVAGRMAEQTRRSGLLKAVGGTPRLVAAVLLTEHLLTAFVAALIGLAAGWLVVPVLSKPNDGLIGSPGTPTLSGVTVAVVMAVAFGIAVLSTFGPARRAARMSTVAALADAARPPRPRPVVAALSSWLPAPLLLGVRLVARRPRRLLLAAASTAVTVATVVAVLAFWQGNSVNGVPGGLTNPVVTAVSNVLVVVTVVLIILAAVNAVFMAWATVLETRHSCAVARAFGATPEQVTVGLSAAQILPAAIGALVGVPAGIGFYHLAKHGGTLVSPSVFSLAATLVATLLVIAALTAIPARLGGRRPVIEVLQSEVA